MKRPTISLETVQLIEKLLASGRKHAQIAKQVGISVHTVSAIAQGKHFQQCPERRAQFAARSVVATDPTPDQIAERCEEILRQRPKRERRGTPYEFPTFSKRLFH